MNYLVFKKSLDNILKKENIKTNEYYFLLNQLKAILNKNELDDKEAVQIHFIIYQLSLINRNSDIIEQLLSDSKKLIKIKKREIKSKLSIKIIFFVKTLINR